MPHTSGYHALLWLWSCGLSTTSGFMLRGGPALLGGGALCLERRREVLLLKRRLQALIQGFHPSRTPMPQWPPDWRPKGHWEGLMTDQVYTPRYLLQLPPRPPNLGADSGCLIIYMVMDGPGIVCPSNSSLWRATVSPCFICGFFPVWRKAFHSTFLQTER